MLLLSVHGNLCPFGEHETKEGMAHNSAWPWPQKYQFDELSLVGNSLAGQGTSFLCPELSIAFDVAFGLPYLLPARDYFVSHAHMDHAGGIPYLISQKALLSLPPPRFYVPQSVKEPLVEILSAWEQMEGHKYKYEIHELRPEDAVTLKGAWSVRAFSTLHRVPSLGYTVFKHRKKLKSQYHNLGRQELLDLKSRGVELEEVWEEPWVSFTGDTQIEFLDKDSHVTSSKLLVMEVTYIDAKKSVAASREWGHIHLDELLPRLNSLHCEKILLIHLSARYRPEELEKILELRLPPEWKGRVDVFPQSGTLSSL